MAQNITPELYNIDAIRYSHRALPPYSYVPGISAHPFRDPAGHSFGKETSEKIIFHPDEWQKSEEYLFGVDLFNHAFWWEAHEVWEGVWKTLDRDSDAAQLLQGLIQIAAAFIKWWSNDTAGLEKLYTIGLSRIESVGRKNNFYLGIDILEYVEILRNHFAAVLGVKKNKSDRPVAPTPIDPRKNYPYLVLK